MSTNVISRYAVLRMCRDRFSSIFFCSAEFNARSWRFDGKPRGIYAAQVKRLMKEDRVAISEASAAWKFIVMNLS